MNRKQNRRYERAERAAGNPDPWYIDFDSDAGETGADAVDRAEARKHAHAHVLAQRHGWSRIRTTTGRNILGYLTCDHGDGTADVYWDNIGQVYAIPTTCFIPVTV